MRPATGALVIEAIAAVAALVCCLVGWALLERSGRQRATRDAATAATRARLQGKRVVVEADRRAAAEAAAAERTSVVDAAIDDHITAIVELDKRRAEIDGAESAEAAADALRRAFE